MKIKISYEDEKEMNPVLLAVSSVLTDCRIKKYDQDEEYKHICITTPRKYAIEYITDDEEDPCSAYINDDSGLHKIPDVI